MFEVSVLILIGILTLKAIAEISVTIVRAWDARRNGNPSQPATLGNLTEAMGAHSEEAKKIRDEAVTTVVNGFDSKINDLVLNLRAMKVSFNELKESVKELVMKEQVREQVLRELRSKVKGTAGE
jgi:hypothetical protein